jgi:hypothetical protein
MLRGSEVLNKIIFWLENLYYILELFLYEVALVPYIYLRLIYNIAKVAEVKNAIGLILLWIPFGPFFLTYGVLKDMYFYFKILCDYKEDDDAFLIKQEEDKLQDHIVIYNEIIDTLRAIMNVFKYKKKKKLAKWSKKSPSPGGNKESPR